MRLKREGDFIALQVWLPLNGTVENQGLYNVEFAASNATINSSGKIGSCYSLNGSNSFIEATHDKTMWDDKEITFAIWFKCDQSKSSGTIMEIAADLALGYVYNSTGVRFTYWRSYLNTSNARAGDSNTGTTYYDASKWHHVAVTFAGPINKLYVDGELSQTWDSSSKYTVNFKPLLASGYNRISIGLSRGSTSYTGGLINDVRFYDHALSAREVKEIAKGLVLHYTLSDNSVQTLNNVYSYPTFNTSSDAGGWFHWGRTGHKGTYSQNTNKDYIYKKDQTYSHCVANGADATGEYLLYQSPTFDGGVRSLQCICKEENGLEINESIVFPTWNARSGGALNDIWTSIIPLRDNFYLCKCEGIQQDGSNDLIGFYVCKGYKVYFSEAYVENDRDICSDIFFSNDIVYDVSGFNNNGMKVGSLICSSDTPKYWTSTYFNGGDNAITVPFNTIISNSAIPFTINLWWKKTELGSDNYESLFGGPSGFEMDTRAGASSTLSLYMASTRGGNVYSPFSLNTWYMVTMASDRTNEYYYVNGELVKTIEAKSMPSGNYFIGAWGNATGQNYKGYLSDFRIYSTCLSADDILELYNTPISLTSNGVLLTSGEYTEA